jgi:predicted nucleotidyltransferase
LCISPILLYFIAENNPGIVHVPSFSTAVLDRAILGQRREREKLRRVTLKSLKRLLPPLAQRYGIERVYLFGSLLKPGRFHVRSDVDIAVYGLTNEFYFAFMGHLSRTIKRDVDVIQLEGYDGTRILRESRLIWKRAK